MLDGVQDLKHIERIGAHSHIRGLGVANLTDNELASLHIADGLVGQWKARRAAALVVSLAKQGKISGRGILLAGKPGTGKTAIAMGIGRSLSQDVPFVALAASEIYSHSLSKTESLTQALRKAIGIRIHESGECIQGEVVEISIDLNSLTNNTGKITIRTTDMEGSFELGARMISSLRKERIGAGDVVTIDKATGKITKLGRSFGKAREFDASGAEVRFVPVPEGELIQTKTVTHTISLHDVDIVNSTSSAPQNSLMSLFTGDTGEIRQEVRDSINSKVRTWIEEGKAEIVPGVLFIDEVHMLDLECFAFLNRAIEGSCTGYEAGWSPLVVMASNRGICKVRGTQFQAPHGIPGDFLDRLVIIATQEWTSDEIREILKIRASEEDVSLSNEALTRLVEIATTQGCSLRYAMQLIMAAQCARSRRKSPSGSTVDLVDIDRVYKLFLNVERSTEYLKGQESNYMELN